jgi:COP9 signalosome complex subunit 3
MDELLQKLLVFPPHPPPQTPLSDHAYDEGIKAQHKTLKDLSESKLLAQTSSGESILDVSFRISLAVRWFSNMFRLSILR